jgi:LmbE family N-acetylglucosaminyl deacetylase
MAIEMLGDIKAKEVMLILSPHLDDAVLSVGGIMEQAARAGIDVVVGTIFTADPGPSDAVSPVARELHAAWGLGDAPFVVRREEDIAAVTSLGARYIHGGLIDAIYRRDAAGEVLYPTRASVFSGPSEREGVRGVLRKLLTDWTRDLGPRVVLCP